MDIEQVGNHHFRIYCGSDVNTINRITQMSVASGWELFEIIPEVDSLEETFVQLTRGENRPLIVESGEDSR